MTQRYRTLAAPATAELEIKHSRFRCTVAPAADEAAARAVIEQARHEHWDARHHCSAFILGPDAATERSSDDGEPSGTAGMPMLQALRGAGLSDVVAVVTRWFGGTLLGTGGLIRAYSGAVAAALENAPRRTRETRAVGTITVDHGAAGRLESELRRLGAAVLDVDYAARATLTLAVSDAHRDAIDAMVATELAGASSIAFCGERWVDVDP